MQRGKISRTERTSRSRRRIEEIRERERERERERNRERERVWAVSRREMNIEK